MALRMLKSSHTFIALVDAGIWGSLPSCLIDARLEFYDGKLHMFAVLTRGGERLRLVLNKGLAENRMCA